MINLELTEKEAAMLRQLLGNAGFSKQLPKEEDLEVFSDLVSKILDLPGEKSTTITEFDFKNQEWWDKAQDVSKAEEIPFVKFVQERSKDA